MYNFNALTSRMKYIPRWSLMRQTHSEDISQHTTEVMLIAHTLCAISIEFFSHEVNSSNVVISCLYHDISEIITSDMPTPVKYKDESLKNAYKQIEHTANERLLQTTHPDIQKHLKEHIFQTSLSDYERQILKAADKISALIKCIDEINSGNSEFKSAYKSIFSIIENLNLDCANYFLENMLPAYNLCLDELVEI